MSSSRTTLRYEVHLAARLTIEDQLLSCVVRDVSLGGAYVRGPIAPAGARVMLRFADRRLADIEVPCVARWHDERGTGLAFEGLRVIDTYTLAKFIRASRVTGKRVALT